MLDSGDRVLVDRGVAFDGPDGADLDADCYRRPDAADSPALVYVHGGAWTTGSNGQFARYCLRLASAGYVGVDTTYRLAPGVGIASMVADVRAAVRWTRENAADLGVDPDRIALVGHSAGAHLAALAAAVGDEPIAAVVGFAGIYDARDPDDDAYRSLAREWSLAECSPLLRAEAAPPTLLAHAVDDDIVDVAETDRYYEALLDAGVAAERFRADGGGHVFLYDDTGPYQRCVDRVRGFLADHL